MALLVPAAIAPAAAQAIREGVRSDSPAVPQTPRAPRDVTRSQPGRPPAQRPASKVLQPPLGTKKSTAHLNLSLPSWAQDSIGLHPIRLSLNAQSSYAAYLRNDNPLVFVVSRTGRYAIWRYCFAGRRCSAATAARLALASCDRIGFDKPCYIYAVGRERVWRGKVEMETALGAAVHTAADTELRGPEKAKGVIFYFRGYGGWRFPPHLDYRRVPPYLRRFARAGWDVKTVEVPYYNRPPWNLPRIAKLIHRIVGEAREQKYRKVVLAGQSRGAWEIISAANDPLPVEALILVAPAAHGTRLMRNGRRNANFDRGNPAFQALLQRLKAPRIAFAFFRRDPYMPASRAELARAALGDRPGVSLFLIRQPEGLPGHSAAWSANFARTWGGCLERFVAAPAKAGPFECRPTRVKVATPELIYSSTHLFEHGAKTIDPAELKALLDGKRLYAAPEPRDDSWWDFGRDGRVTVKLAGAWMRPNPVHARWETRGSRLCVIGSPFHGKRVFCYTVYRAADNVLALVTRTNIVRLMYLR